MAKWSQSVATVTSSTIKDSMLKKVNSRCRCKAAARRKSRKSVVRTRHPKSNYLDKKDYDFAVAALAGRRRVTAENAPQRTAENGPPKNGPQAMDRRKWTARKWTQKMDRTKLTAENGLQRMER